MEALIFLNLQLRFSDSQMSDGGSHISKYPTEILNLPNLRWRLSDLQIPDGGSHISQPPTELFPI